MQELREYLFIVLLNPYELYVHLGTIGETRSQVLANTLVFKFLLTISAYLIKRILL